MGKRGVVITPYRITGATSFTTENIDARLRRYLVYWDRIDVHTNNIIHVELSPDVSILETEGILTRTRSEFSGIISGDSGTVLSMLPFAAFLGLEKKDPGCWALAHEGLTLDIPSDLAVNSRNIEIELHNALLGPEPGTPFEKILDFKTRRAPELAAFRDAMDNLYQGIRKEADIPRATDTAIRKIESSLVSLNKTIKAEPFLSRLVRTMKVELNVPAIAEAAQKGAKLGALVAPFVATKFGLPLCDAALMASSVGAGVNAAASVLKFELSQSKTLKLSDKTSDFAYLYHVEKELGPGRSS